MPEELIAGEPFTGVVGSDGRAKGRVHVRKAPPEAASKAGSPPPFEAGADKSGTGRAHRCGYPAAAPPAPGSVRSTSGTLRANQPTLSPNSQTTPRYSPWPTWRISSRTPRATRDILE